MTQVSRQETQFRIDGVYRDANNRVQRLLGTGYGGASIPEGTAWAQFYARGVWVGDGFRTLSDGKDTSDYKVADLAFPRDLIPGELHNVNGQWVPMEEAPKRVETLGERTHAEVIKDALQNLVDDLNEDMLRRDNSPRKPLLGQRPAWFDAFPGYEVTSYSNDVEPYQGAAFGMRNPDQCHGPADHLNASRHQMAGMSKS